jgi:hypothetical protein
MFNCHLEDESKLALIGIGVRVYHRFFRSSLYISLRKKFKKYRPDRLALKHGLSSAVSGKSMMTSAMLAISSSHNPSTVIGKEEGPDFQWTVNPSSLGCHLLDTGGSNFSGQSVPTKPFWLTWVIMLPPGERGFCLLPGQHGYPHGRFSGWELAEAGDLRRLGYNLLRNR